MRLRGSKTLTRYHGSLYNCFCPSVQSTTLVPSFCITIQIHRHCKIQTLTNLLVKTCQLFLFLCFAPQHQNLFSFFFFINSSGELIGSLCWWPTIWFKIRVIHPNNRSHTTKFDIRVTNNRSHSIDWFFIFCQVIVIFFSLLGNTLRVITLTKFS